jgi:hypothetical protein
MKFLFVFIAKWISTYKPIQNSHFLTEVSFGLAVGQFRHVDGVSPVRKREFNSRIVELLDMWATALVVSHFFHSNDLLINELY